MNEKPETFNGVQFVPSKPESWGTVDSFIWPQIAAKLVREQHAENKALTATRDRQAAMLRRLEDREAELDAEIGLLRRENERLRDELRQSSIDSTRAEVERLKGAMLKAMAMLDKHDPEPAGAFAVLLLALNPELQSAKNAALRREET